MRARTRNRGIISKRRVLGGVRRLDSVAMQREYGDGSDIVQECRGSWESLRQFRKERERCLRYLYGDQWGDEIMRNGMGVCTERDMITEQGDVPLTNNLIRKLVRTMVGVMRNQNKIPSCSANDRDEQGLGDVMTVALQVNWRVNYKKEMDARCFEDYLAGGVACQKETYGWLAEKQRSDAWSWWPNLNKMFWDANSTDFRGWDLNLIGELHDWTFAEVCDYFMQADGDVERLRDIFDHCKDIDYLKDWWSTYESREDRLKLKNLDFFMPTDHRLCRVIEVWKRESKERYHVWDQMTGELTKCELSMKPLIEMENAKRLAEGIAAGMEPEDIPMIELKRFVDRYWYYRFMSPRGDILMEGETPYEHKSHPYVLKMYPMVNGEIHSFVGDVIDQQRYVNRLISLNDKLIRSAAKGVLLYPVSMIPEGKTAEEIQREWSNPDSVLFYDDVTNRQTGARPEQYANKLVNIGTTEMIQMQMGLIEEISGVNGALQGKPGFSGQSATLYAQQTMNASTSVLDLLESYEDLILRGAEKKVKNIQQYYSDRRTMSIAGRGMVVEYDPELCGNIDFDLSINEAADTPIARMQNNDVLMQMFQMGAINIRQLLENGSWPFTDRLLESLKADEAAAMEQQGQMLQTQAALGEAAGAMPQDTGNLSAAEKTLQYPILTPDQVQKAVAQKQQEETGLVGV